MIEYNITTPAAARILSCGIVEKKLIIVQEAELINSVKNETF